MKGCQHLILFKNSDLLNLKLFNSQDSNDKTIAAVDIKQIICSLDSSTPFTSNQQMKQESKQSFWPKT